MPLFNNDTAAREALATALGSVPQRALAGYVQVYYDGQWGFVNGIDATGTAPWATADVLCRQLSFATGMQYSGLADSSLMGILPSVPSPASSDSGVPTWLAVPACTGSEAALMDCPRARPAVGPAAGTPLAVVCYPGAMTDDVIDRSV